MGRRSGANQAILRVTTMKTTDGWDWVGVPKGMSADVAGLLDAISDAGDDDTPRLIVADALDESGKEDFGGFVRRQCRDLLKNGIEQNGVRLCSTVSFGFGDHYRVTAEVLASKGPWDCADWRSKSPPDRGHNLALIDMASRAYRNKSATIYPRLDWHRGFMSTVRHVTAYSLFRIVESGVHAWHPWQPFPEPDEKKLLETEEWTSGTAYGWNTLMHGFRINSMPVQEQGGWGSPGAGGGMFYQYFYTLARRVMNGSGKVKWQVRGDDLPHTSMSVVPEPIARFMTGKTSAHTDRAYYPTYRDAERDLNRAARLFVCEAAKQSRKIVIERGGTMSG